MLDQMEELKQKEYQAKQLLNRAEYKALQAQVNPHFYIIHWTQWQVLQKFEIARKSVI